MTKIPYVGVQVEVPLEKVRWLEQAVSLASALSSSTETGVVVIGVAGRGPSMVALDIRAWKDSCGGIKLIAPGEPIVPEEPEHKHEEENTP